MTPPAHDRAASETHKYHPASDRKGLRARLGQPATTRSTLMAVLIPLAVALLSWGFMSLRSAYDRSVADPVVRNARFSAESVSTKDRFDSLMALRRVDSIIDAGNQQAVIDRLDRILSRPPR